MSAAASLSKKERRNPVLEFWTIGSSPCSRTRHLQPSQPPSAAPFFTQTSNPCTPTPSSPNHDHHLPRKHQPSLPFSYREHANHSNSNHLFSIETRQTRVRGRMNRKYRGRNRGSTGKKNQRNKWTKKSTTRMSRRKEHKYKKIQRDQPTRLIGLF